MDINSNLGQQSLADERFITKWIEDRFQVRWLETPKDQPAIIDGLIEKDGVLESVVEVKVRYDLSISNLVNKWNSEWLVTWEKVDKTIRIAKLLGVSATGVLYMPHTKELIIQKLADETGRLTCKIRLETTETQATINGGLATRTNAFIDISRGHQYSII